MINSSKKSNINSQWLITILICSGMLTSYIALYNPAAMLTIIMKDLNINLAQAGLGISIIFPVIIASCLTGGYLEQKWGVKQLFIWSLVFISIGLFLNYVVVNFALFLAGRILFAVGFGLNIPFIGAAIMTWYTPEQREYMNTLTTLFPPAGIIIMYAGTMPMYAAMANSWRYVLAFWGFIAIITAVIWGLGVKKKAPEETAENCSQLAEKEKHLYRNLSNIREIRILGFTFICDYFSYAFVASILPTFYHLEGGLTLEAANNLSTIFPLAGIAGAVVAGFILIHTGRRKPMLWIGQGFKFLGIILLVIGVKSPVGLAGIILLGIGDFLWLPSMYTIPMDLEAMTPTRVAAAMAFISSCGFVAGSVSPVLGGWLSDLISIHNSLLIFAIPNLIASITCMTIRETGPSLKKNIKGNNYKQQLRVSQRKEGA